MERNYICGILFCYNEEHIIEETIKHYLSQGFDIVLVDNESTDNSVRLANRADLKDILTVKTDGYEWRKILKTACEYMHKNLTHYRWISLIDADSFYQSPMNGINLVQLIQWADKKRFNILNGKVIEFYPTEKDDPNICSHTERIKYYKSKKVSWVRPEQMDQNKIFRYHPSIDFYSSYGHICKRRDRRVFPLDFHYHHYPWVSVEHGIKKIFQDRKPRYFTERKTDPSSLGLHYSALLPKAKDLMKPSQELTFYRDSIKSSKLFYLSVKQAAIPLMYLKRSYMRLHESVRCGRLSKYREKITRIIIGLKEKNARLMFRSLSQKSPKNPLRSVNTLQILTRGPFAIGFPKTYHLLLTDFCNVDCGFCNQEFMAGVHNQINIGKFKKIFQNLIVDGNTRFVLSGGGEPMLCKDLFVILDFLQRESPEVCVVLRTNGTLIGEMAERLADSHLQAIEISVHGSSEETNATLLGARSPIKVFSGLSRLDQTLKKRNKKIKRVFCPNVSQKNIRELPRLIGQAIDLGVEEIDVSFTRYFEKNKGLSKESLFFEQPLYDQTIKSCKSLAKRKGIRFFHEPLFSERFAERKCTSPWDTMVIDPAGDTFPCTGGEVWFNKLHDKKRKFGNISDQHIVEIWNNDAWIALRRTLDPKHPETFVPECNNCHNTLCFKGPNVLEAHVV